MRKFPFILCLCMFIGLIFASCMDNDSDNWEKYKTWRELNDSWLKEQIARKNADGTDYYRKVVASWDSQATVYIHYFNDTALTRDNLSPLYTSTVDVKYIGRLYDNTPFDSSYLRTSPADSIFRTDLSSSSVIQGWSIAVSKMHIGDSCAVLIPYNVAYGSTGQNTISPYSNLLFNIKLVGIPGYVIKP